MTHIYSDTWQKRRGQWLANKVSTQGDSCSYYLSFLIRQLKISGEKDRLTRKEIKIITSFNLQIMRARLNGIRLEIILYMLVNCWSLMRIPCPWGVLGYARQSIGIGMITRPGTSRQVVLSYIWSSIATREIDWTDDHDSVSIDFEIKWKRTIPYSPLSISRRSFSYSFQYTSISVRAYVRWDAWICVYVCLCAYVCKH